MKNFFEIKVVLKTSRDVKDFCFTTVELPRAVSVKAAHEDFVVDGRSILGMFSLNLSEPITIRFESSARFDTDKIQRMFNPWIVED